MAETSSYNLFWCCVHLLDRSLFHELYACPQEVSCTTVQVTLYCGNIIQYNIIMFVSINQSVRCSQYDVAYYRAVIKL